MESGITHEKFTAIVALLIGIFVYFIPAFVAYNSRKNNKGAITLLNIFLGWTIVGWVVALVWAASRDKSNQTVIYQKPTNPVADTNQNTVVNELEKLSTLYNNGQITQEEYQILKNKLIAKFD